MVAAQNKDGSLDVAELSLLMDPRHYIHSLNEVRQSTTALWQRARRFSKGFSCFAVDCVC